MKLFNRALKISQFYQWLGLAESWEGIRFLSYHNIFKKSECLSGFYNDHYSISDEELRIHLQLILANNVKVIAMDDAIKMLESNKHISDRYICLTFDDGYMDNYSIAWPIIKDFGCTAHFFIVSDFIGKSLKSLQYMGCQEILSLVKQGATIGSHSHNHPVLSKMRRLDDVCEQLEKSKHMLTDILGEEIDTFAYPNSQFNSSIIDKIKAVGYHWAFSIGLGTVKRVSEVNRWHIVRNVMMNNAETCNKLMIIGAYDWAGSYSKVQNYIKCMRKSELC